MKVETLQNAKKTEGMVQIYYEDGANPQDPFGWAIPNGSQTSDLVKGMMSS